jgi:hypothetical protein
LASLGVSAAPLPFSQRRSQAYDRLADTLETALDLKKLDQMIKAGI